MLKPPVPLMTPAKFWLVPSAPVVSVAAPRVTLPPVVPPPATEPMALLNPVMFRIAPVALPRITSELELRPVVLPALSWV